jgi:hypothetical protein
LRIGPSCVVAELSLKLENPKRRKVRRRTSLTRKRIASYPTAHILIENPSRLTLQNVPGQRALLQGPQMLLVEFLLGQNGLGALGHFARLLIVQPAVAFSTRLGILLPGSHKN